MVIQISPDLVAVLRQVAQRDGTNPEALALGALRERFLPHGAPPEPRDEWERRLLAIATDCGVSLSNEAISSDGIYE